MGQIPNFGAPRQYSLTVSGKAVDAKAVGDKINTINEILSPLKTTKLRLEIGLVLLLIVE